MTRFFAGLVIGIAATGCMTAWELVFHRRHGLEACLDWDINQHLLRRVNGKPASANLAAGLALHVIVGAVVGAGFAAVGTWSPRSTFLLALAFGVLLWMLLLPLGKIATGRSPIDGRLGRLPVLISLVGHLIYGAVLGALVVVLNRP